MMISNRKERDQVEFFSIEEFVPQEHLLRKIDRAVDFTHVYDFVSDLYCKDNGRPSVDPVVLVKMVLIQHLYGISSLRRTHEEISMNVAYRWFLGYLMNEPIPHFSTVSYNFKHRFNEHTVESIFHWILKEINSAGYLSPEAVFIDGTHIKANANMKKVVKKAVPEAARIYEEQLRKEINEDRENHNKKPLKDKNEEEKEKIINESTTDPESGVFHKGEHKKCLAYSAQTACDKNGYVMGVKLNPGNVHDSVAFDKLYDELVANFPQIETVVADAGYKTPWICKKIIDDKRVPSMPYKRPMTKNGFFKKHDYAYDEYYDCYVCPNYKVLKYTTTNRDGYKEYKSNPKDCAKCDRMAQCTESKNHQKIVARHIWEEYIELTEDYRYTPKYKDLYEQRKETIERVFADAKEKHAMRYTQYRGLAQVSNWVRLKFAAMNLKKYAIHKWEMDKKYHDPHHSCHHVFNFLEVFSHVFNNCKKLNPVFT